MEVSAITSLLITLSSVKPLALVVLLSAVNTLSNIYLYFLQE
jgi:hypothetical protein